LNNVARHSGAKEAWVTVEEQVGGLSLEIRDNGAGFVVGPEDNRVAGQGIGLMGMRERAEHLKGSFSIRSSPQRGTVVSVHVPLQRPSLDHTVQEVS
jgi:signal transduction histidine kinase